jgi:hypothetical protein
MGQQQRRAPVRDVTMCYAQETGGAMEGSGRGRVAGDRVAIVLPLILPAGARSTWSACLTVQPAGMRGACAPVYLCAAHACRCQGPRVPAKEASGSRWMPGDDIPSQGGEATQLVGSISSRTARPRVVTAAVSQPSAGHADPACAMEVAVAVAKPGEFVVALEAPGGALTSQRQIFSSQGLPVVFQVGAGPAGTTGSWPGNKDSSCAGAWR